MTSPLTPPNVKPSLIHISTMKPISLFAYPTATICLVLTASAELRPSSSINRLILNAQELIGKHNPLIHNMPSEEISTGVIISDVIGKTQSIAIFSGLTRDIDTVSGRLEDAAQNATVLAPDNSAMKNLKRKPWEDPKDYETFGANAYGGGEGEDRAHRNLRRFVEAHIVPQSPWKEGEKIKTLAGDEIWYEIKDGKKKVGSFFSYSGTWANRLIRFSPKVLKYQVLQTRSQMERYGL